MKKQSSGSIGFIRKTSKFQLILGFLFLVVCVFVYSYLYCYYKMGFEKQWGGWLEAAATFGIVGISLSIWYNEKIENWQASLPKKLNITYKLKNSEGSYENFCQIHNAPLAHEGDIRNWGQSIGQTILKGARIDFSGFLIDKPVRNKKSRIMQYSLTVYLQNEISGIKKGSIITFNESGFVENPEVYQDNT